MDKLEQYLDQVCRRIGGPRSLRQHVRQELREHLLDAVAGHKAAGMPEAEALARALEDFGGPEQVRSELEATHGHRLLPVVIDKAMQWKEMTMRAKWLWTSWAYLALAGVIALEVLFLVFSGMYLVPKFRYWDHHWFQSLEAPEHGVAWMPGFLYGLVEIGEHATWIALGVLVVWGLFEWRVRSENKPFMRLSAMGTAAVGLTFVVMLTAASMIIPFMLGLPAIGRIARPFATEQLAAIDTSVSALEQSAEKQDWAAVEGYANRASSAITKLGIVVDSLTIRHQPPTVADLRGHLHAANEALLEAQRASREKDAERVNAAVKEFHERYAPVTNAAKQPGR